MTLDEAIEIKQLALDTGVVDDKEDFLIADQMSIEAMKRHQHLRARGWEVLQHLLPGETKD